MKKLIALLLALVMVVGLVACAPAASEDTKGTEPNNATSGKEDTKATEPAATESETYLQLAWTQAMGVDTMFENPHRDKQSLYPYMIFDPMGWYDSLTGEYIPALASEWTINDELTEFTFTIREGVKWHDGEDLTVDDVLFSVYSAILNPNGNSVADFKNVVGQEAFVNGEADTVEGITVEGNTITFKTSAPYSGMLADVCGLYVLPEHHLADSGYADVDTDDFWKSPVGTGPYVIDEVHFPDYFTCTRNDNYWGEKAGIKNVQFTCYQSGGLDAQVAAMLNGNLDYMFWSSGIDIETANLVTLANSVSMINIPGYNARSLWFNIDTRVDGNNKEILKDKNVRKAIRMLINEPALAEFYAGQAVTTQTFIPVNDPYFNDAIELEADVDVAGAKALLDAAGFDYENTVIDLAYYYSTTVDVDSMELVKQQLAEAGVKCNAFLLTGDLAAAIYTERNYDILYAQAGNSQTNPVDVFKQYSTYASYTWIGDLENREKYNALYDGFYATLDTAKRMEIMHEVQALAYDECYGINLFLKDMIELVNHEHVQWPTERFAAGAGGYYDWSNWKILY